MAAKGTILVTGANGGLGSAIAEQIASKAELSTYHGLYTVRDTAHAPALTSALEHGTAHSHDLLALDLTKLDNVRSVAEDVNVSSPGHSRPCSSDILLVDPLEAFQSLYLW